MSVFSYQRKTDGLNNAHLTCLVRMKKESLNPDSFEQRLADAIDEGHLVPRGSSVLLGVSGGADSVALLHALHCLVRRGGDFTITIAHLDHCLREESADDAAFVADFAEKLGVKCILQRRNVAGLADQLGEGVEHAARVARFDFFREAAKSCSASTVALAHHADDNVETILFRILRGTALRGLAGILPSRDLQPGLKIIRPMLKFYKSEILEYCKLQNLNWRKDHTNDESLYRRNFIRNELLPLIRDRINPKVDEALLRLGSLAGQTEEFLTTQARKVLEDSISHTNAGRILIDVKMISAAEPTVRMTAYRLALQDLDLPQRDLTADHLISIDMLLTGSGRVVNLPGQFSARREPSQLLLMRNQNNRIK